MLFFQVALLIATLSMGCSASKVKHLEERQGEGEITYTVTCIGPRCTDYPPTTFQWPTGWPQPTSTPQTTLKTTSSIKKTTSTSRYTPPPETSSIKTTKKTSSRTQYTPPPETPTKTTKSSQKPTKTQSEVTGPSSTKCPVPLYYQCGGYWDGEPWSGCTKCERGAKCQYQNDFYYQCVAEE